MIGTLIHRKYRLDEHRGSGGFASVYAATNVLINRQVALKILHSHLAEKNEIVERFLREAKLSCKRIHPTIVPVEDIGRTEDGAPFLVMELIEGRTLATVVEQEGALSIARSLEIATLLLEGLAAAHDQGIIHRDVKPGNIFLVAPGFAAPPVRILDLGMAKDLGDTEELTLMGDVIGTPNYVAPEMLLHPGESRWLPVVDVFSAGMVFFFMLTGRLPFDLERIELGYQAILARASFYNSINELRGPREFEPTVPASIDSVVRRALALDPQQRYQDAGEMLSALEGAIDRLHDDPEPAPYLEFDDPLDAPTIPFDRKGLGMIAGFKPQGAQNDRDSLEDTLLDEDPLAQTVEDPPSPPVQYGPGPLPEPDPSPPQMMAPTPTTPVGLGSQPPAGLGSQPPAAGSPTRSSPTKRKVEPLWIVAAVLGVLVTLVAAAIVVTLMYGR